MARRYLRILNSITILALTGAVSPALAAEKMHYGIKLSPISQNLIKKHLIGADSALDSFSIAKTDLNEDGIDEFVLKPKQCGADKKTCEHVILAQSEERPVILGTIKARDIALGHKYTNGIRNLLVFKDEVNDFRYDVYVWEPAQSQYILSKQ